MWRRRQTWAGGEKAVKDLHRGQGRELKPCAASDAQGNGSPVPAAHSRSCTSAKSSPARWLNASDKPSTLVLQRLGSTDMAARVAEEMREEGDGKKGPGERDQERIECPGVAGNATMDWAVAVVVKTGEHRSQERL